jgi:site-specific recombinase XerD
MKNAQQDQWIRQKSAGSDNLNRWIDSFMLDRKSQDLAQGTLHFYTWKLKLFTEYAGAHGITRISQITSSYIRDFMISLSMSHNPGGVHAAFRCLRAFLYWYEKETDIEWSNPIRNVKPPKIALAPLEPVEFTTVKKLLKTCNLTEFYGARDYAMFLFLLDTGIRASELTALDIDDVDPILGDVNILHGKGGKPRMVVIGKRTRKAVRSYLKFRNDTEYALWVTNERTRLTYWGLVMILKRRSKLAKVEQPSLHSFRRAFALACLRSGMDILSISKLLGHSNLSVVQRYLAQTGEDLRLAHIRAGPVDNM